MMKLVDIYTLPSMLILYNMLKDRPPEANISHRKMPTIEEHCTFVSSRPYEAWYLIEDTKGVIGNCYLSKANEIGISVNKSAQGNGFGSWAVQEIMRLHGPRRYLANVAANNTRSQLFFMERGFKPIQYTFEKDTRC